ncbi:MAG: chromate transporter [Halanaerobiaceae bacterium]
MNKKRLRDLFIIFFRIGGFTIGGGYAMLPLIERELVLERGWLSEKEFLDIFAIIQGIPGVIAVNSALYIGYKLEGISGAISAGAGMSLPPVLIIFLVIRLFFQARGLPVFEAFFSGIRSCVVVLIFWAGYRMGKKAVVSGKSIFYTLGMIVGLEVFNLHPIILIIIAGLAGLIFAEGEEKKTDDTI